MALAISFVRGCGESAIAVAEGKGRSVAEKKTCEKGNGRFFFE